MERINLDALEALAKATPGEIRSLPNGGACLPEDPTYWSIEAGQGYYDGPESGGFNLTGFIDPANAQRIVASYNALPALIAEVRQLRQEAERARWCEEKKAEVSWSDISRRWRVMWLAGGMFDIATDPDRSAAIDAARGGK